MEKIDQETEQADALAGCWKLVHAQAWDEHGQPLPAPYGERPMGTMIFEGGRMLASLCNGDELVNAEGSRAYSSYGGAYRFDGHRLDVLVDIAVEKARIGGHQIREVKLDGPRMVLRPPTRAYGEERQQRELVWERISL